MASINWYLQTNIEQAFDERPSSAWHTMLGMAASMVRGNDAAANRFIAYYLGVNEREVRRWRNQGMMPSPRNRRFFFDKMYRLLVDRKLTPVDGRIFFPVGFQVIVPEWSRGVDLDDLRDEYNAAVSMIIKPGSPKPRITPQAGTVTMRDIEEFLTDGEVAFSGAASLVFEHAVSGPDRVWPSSVVVRYHTEEGRVVRDVKIDSSTKGYMDYFNPYDIPTMLARIYAVLKIGTSGSYGGSSNLASSLSRLYDILRYDYGFYSPGETKRAHANLDRTAKFMRWLAKMIPLAAELDASIESERERRRAERKNRTDAQKAKERERAKKRRANRTEAQKAKDRERARERRRRKKK